MGWPASWELEQRALLSSQRKGGKSSRNLDLPGQKELYTQPVNTGEGSLENISNSIITALNHRPWNDQRIAEKTVVCNVLNIVETTPMFSHSLMKPLNGFPAIMTPRYLAGFANKNTVKIKPHEII